MRETAEMFAKFDENTAKINWLSGETQLKNPIGVISVAFRRIGG